MQNEVKTFNCPVCGFNKNKEKNGRFDCEACGVIYYKVSNEEMEQLNSAQRELELYNFKKADELYSKLINKTNNEMTKVMCNFGRLLAYFGIVYIRDFDDKLKITFSNYDSYYESITESTYYEQIKKSQFFNSYEQKIKELDDEYKRIKEEIDKLKNDPKSVKAYDVFICSKISLRKMK